jgi:hypothetical protein
VFMLPIIQGERRDARSASSHLMTWSRAFKSSCLARTLGS